jgi:hypothetical protein
MLRASSLEQQLAATWAAARVGETGRRTPRRSVRRLVRAAR